MEARIKAASPLFLCRRINQSLNARDSDQTTRFYQFREQLDHVCHGLVDHSSVYPRVEVVLGSRNIDAKVGDTSDAIGECWTIGGEPVVVRLSASSGQQEHAKQRRKCPKIPTIQTQSTPAKNPCSPFAASCLIHSSSPTLPLSSIPSNRKRTLTGSAKPSL